MELPIYPRSCFGPSEPGLCFGLIWRGLELHGAYHSFRLGEWDIGPISLSPSIAPQPLCTDCVGKGCNSSCNGCYFHVSAWKRANSGLIVVTCCAIMMTLWVSRLFFIFPSFSFADLLCLEFLWSCILLFIFSDLLFRFLLALHLPLLCRVFFWRFSWADFFCLVPGSTASLSLCVLFDWYDEALGFSCLDFVFTVCFHHGSESFFFFAYWR